LGNSTFKYEVMRYVSAFILIVAIGLGMFFATRPIAQTFDGEHSVSAFLSAPYRALKQQLVSLNQEHASNTETTILLLGKAGPGWTAGELTDTLILASLSGATKSADLLSIPRDLMVRTGSYQGKVNALWQIGKQENRGKGTLEHSAYIRNVVEDITGVTIDEVIVVDVSAVEQIVNTLGGVSINVVETIVDRRYPTPGGGIETFSINPGFQVLDGATAVKYARTRHTKEGDFGRIRRQHQVIESIVSKARGLKLTEDFTTIISLLDALGDHIETTLSLEEIANLISLSSTIPFSNVETFALETLQARGSDDPLLMGAGFASGLIPRAGFYDYSAIHEAVSFLLEQT